MKQEISMTLTWEDDLYIMYIMVDIGDLLRTSMLKSHPIYELKKKRFLDTDSS